MYLLISDHYAFENERQFFSCPSSWLDEVKTAYPDYVKISVNDIDEVLVYSSWKADDGYCIRTAECTGYTADDRTLRIDYGELQESEETSGKVRRRRYQYYKNTGKLKDNSYPPAVIFIEDIKDYKYIKNGNSGTVINETALQRLTDLMGKSDWIGIVRYFPRINEIEKSDYWNDPQCLAKLSYALNKLATRGLTRPTQEDLRRQKENETYFFKVIERCIELEPFSSMHKSTLAYYLYDRYKKDYSPEDFDRAKDLYENLIVSSSDKFKELYRYTNLQRKHYELPANRYTPESYKEFGNIIALYSELIESYDELSDEKKKANKNNYIKGLYQYVSLFCDERFKRYWDIYFDVAESNASYPAYMVDEERIQLLNRCSDYLDRIIALTPVKPDFNNIKYKPNYFDIQYRVALIEQYKGFIPVLRGKAKDEYLPIFEKSRDIIDGLLIEAETLKKQGARFLYPNYVKMPQSINLFFLGETDKCERCYDRAQPWMKYQKGQMLALFSRYADAISVLKEIPPNDLCYNKAQKLIERLERKL